MDSPGKRLQVLKSLRDLLNPEFTLWEMYVDCKNWFWEWEGFRWNSWKNHSESWKSIRKFVSENGFEPCVWTITCIKLNTMTSGTCRGKVWTQVEWPTNWHSCPYHEATRNIATNPGWNPCWAFWIVHLSSREGLAQEHNTIDCEKALLFGEVC